MSDKNIDKDIEKFLKEYEKICQKYEMGLSGCGCCGSPYLDARSESIGCSEIEEVCYSSKTNDIRIGGTYSGLTIEEYFKKKRENKNE